VCVVHMVRATKIEPLGWPSSGGGGGAHQHTHTHTRKSTDDRRATHEISFIEKTPTARKILLQSEIISENYAPLQKITKTLLNTKNGFFPHFFFSSS